MSEGIVSPGIYNRAVELTSKWELVEKEWKRYQQEEPLLFAGAVAKLAIIASELQKNNVPQTVIDVIQRGVKSTIARNYVAMRLGMFTMWLENEGMSGRLLAKTPSAMEKDVKTEKGGHPCDDAGTPQGTGPS